MKNKITLLIVSDIHAISSNESSKESYLLFKNGRSDFADIFINYTKDLKREIDILICAGDISTSGSKDSFELGWQFLQSTKHEISATELLCVPGNHDHQSRPTEKSYNPKEVMQYAKPSFPLDNFESNTFFWSWNWCHYESNEFSYNAILVNTSGNHGFSEEYRHGRVAYPAIDKIIELINSSKFSPKPINILLCHHHPFKMEHVDDDVDYEAMIGGDRLIRKLANCNKGPWLIIHGHKHFADISYVHAQTIFSAGSLSAKLYPKIEDRTSNQFYIVEIDLEKSESSGKAVGTFEAHESLTGRSWKKSLASHLPKKGGFGSIKTPKQIADKISKFITQDCPFLDESEILAHEPQVLYLTPSELSQLTTILEDSGYNVMREESSIIQIGMKNYG